MARQEKPENNPTESATQEANAPEVDHSTLIIETFTNAAVQLHQISLQLHAVVNKLTKQRKR